MKLCILDTKSANLNSVVQAIKRLGIDPVISADINTLNQADKLILPGVGTALAVMSGINDGNLYDFILNTKKPLLGICLGMQVLGSASAEVPLNSGLKEIETLKIVPEKVKKLHGDNIILPHMGWNTVTHTDHPLFAGIKQNAYFYFVHSFAMDVGDYTIGTCEYGVRFTAALCRDNFMGVQFHPEKSGSVGAKLLNNFINL
ncbi:imidazole glycerol phosphate synthase subunit HisH [uncultured Succinatimonas sp.]|uniref:imidazole glycerol phosphate synthase subunit HisH n=1 Tax=uncultured Succinatimonas sp. TaxID=1262973 RepID=UPI0025F807C3|nr:imidazole glycerol phosphate synthase subunit HisH [uncultured Succinatimonas sp.]